MQGKGKSPLPLHSIPKTNNNSKTKSNNKIKSNNKTKTKTKTKNKIKVVYTEDLTHPGIVHRDSESTSLAGPAVLLLRFSNIVF